MRAVPPFRQQGKQQKRSIQSLGPLRYLLLAVVRLCKARSGENREESGMTAAGLSIPGGSNQNCSHARDVEEQRFPETEGGGVGSMSLSYSHSHFGEYVPSGSRRGRWQGQADIK